MDLSLLRTPASGDLLPSRLAPLLAKWTAPRAKLRGQQLILAAKLSLDDEAAAGFVLDFAGQGARIEATTHGASATLLAWAFAELTRQLKADHRGGGGGDGEGDGDRDGDGDGDGASATLEAALAYLTAYEADVAAHRARRPDDEANAFVAWLKREEVIDVRDGATFDDLPLDDTTYELLLDHEAVEDIFVSERELARLMARFRAR